MSLRAILDTFDTWRAEGREMVLVTVWETAGSTYSKAGHRILIASDGDYQGLVSGGCLEGDLAEQARDVLRQKRARAITYDMRDETDDVFGLGIGCNGLIRVLLQTISKQDDYEPFNTIAKTHRTVNGGVSALCIDGEAGACFITGDTGELAWQCPAPLLSGMRERCATMTAQSSPEIVNTETSSILFSPIAPLPRLLVLGTGPDAIPLIAMAEQLGWLVTAVDHRPHYVDRLPAQLAASRITVVPRTLADTLPLNDFAAVIVMSHHLDTDRHYLEQLAKTSVPYVGLLGPRARKERLLSELNLDGHEFAARLRGPVGLDIRANSPESIALAALAEIHWQQQQI